MIAPFAGVVLCAISHADVPPAPPAAADPRPSPEERAAPIPPPESNTGVLPAPPTRLEDVWTGLGPATVLEDAVARRSSGDFRGADARLAWLAEVAPGEAPTYHAAVSAELQERYEEALAGYDAVLSQWPDGARATDAGFRRALVLEDLGRHPDAVRQVRALQRQETWSREDQLSLELARGVGEVGQGRTRRGLRRLGRALAATEGSETLLWMRAKARATLARHLVEEAAATPMVHGRRASRNLEHRAGKISAAERQVIAIANLGEPEYALAGLEMLGDAYLALYDDIIALPPPPGLSPDAASVYRDGIAERTAVLRRKAWRYYDEGAKLATRTEWQGDITARLRSRRAALGESNE
ncbi:MAG: hypothetical protein VX265_12035 [Myxococcota bacterium]|nr:hypothetical protein [Myxococcota bacterium]MEC8424283.1 hypothetical protein [Myxococcota bacterium]